MPATRIDTAALVDQSSFGKYQTWIFLLCFVAMIVDGYDVQIIGVAAAGIKEALSLEPTVLGLIITAGQVGVILGAAKPPPSRLEMLGASYAIMVAQSRRGDAKACTAEEESAGEDKAGIQRA